MTQTQRLDVRELINTNPLSRFQKLVVLLGFCVIALDGFDIAIMGFIAPTLKQEWGVSNHELGFVISAALIGLALGAIFSGPLADWLGRKKIIINSVFFFGFWTIATALSQNIEQMMVFRFLTGLGLGAAMPNIGTLVSEYAPERQRSFLITIIFCGFTFGAAAGGFSASWLIPQFGWHSLMLLGVFWWLSARQPNVFGEFCSAFIRDKSPMRPSSACRRSPSRQMPCASSSPASIASAQ